MNFDFSAIAEWNMDELQTKAYKTGLFWLYYSRKIFPNYKHFSRYPKKTDPRKSSLFKYCYKLHKDTQGSIPDNEIELYVIAQLQVMKAIKVDGVHPLIEPNCLASNKAWKRWLMWKRKHDALKNTQTTEDVNLDSIPVENIKKELERTKKFLYSKFDGTENQFVKIARDVSLWAYVRKISPFYCVLSDWFQKYCKVDNLDLDIYRKSVNEEVKIFFVDLFKEY
jgi:hypothetical protein